MNKIIDERLEELAYASIYTNVTGEEIRSIAAELLAARERIRADEEHLPTIEVLTQDLYETEQELEIQVNLNNRNILDKGRLDYLEDNLRNLRLECEAYGAIGTENKLRKHGLWVDVSDVGRFQ